MNKTIAASFLLAATSGCSSSDEATQGNGNEGIAWDEASDGELSGDLAAPTAITLRVGDNKIIASSIPGATENCIDAPDGSKTPYYPEHASYTDVFTFTLPAGQTLSAIRVEALEVEAVHSACGIPMDQQLGAFTGLSNSGQIDWDSDTFENFVKLPETYPLIGAAFAKAAGNDLLANYKAGFSFGPFSIDPLAANPTDGTFTFWWKEGANKTAYTLNFVVE